MSARARTDRFAEVRARFAAQHARGAFTAGQLVVERGDEVLVDEALGATADTRFQVMSASKAVVGAAIARLEASGALATSTRVAELWPEFAANGKAEITLEDVLTHRAGLLTHALPLPPERWSDASALRAALAELAPTYPRGTLAYNPVGFGWILAEILHRVTGELLPAHLARTWPSELSGLEFLRAPVTPDAPVARTLWRGPPSLPVGGVDVAADFERVNNEISGVTALVPGAGMFTTARTLARFYTRLLDGSLLGEPALAAATAPLAGGWDRSVRTFVSLGRGFALGWRWPHLFGWWGTARCFGHAGGFSTVAWADPTTKAAIAIVTDTNRGVGDLLRRTAPLGSAIRAALRRAF